LLDLVGDEAVLPPGTRLTDESRPGRQCFVLLEGSATVEAAGHRLRELGPGAFVGVVGRDGQPLPLSGLTVQVATHSRVLVIDARRLAGLIDSDPGAAAAWRRMSQQADTAATALPGAAAGL
jgi:CRP-like cAMP-binding protein